MITKLSEIKYIRSFLDFSAPAVEFTEKKKHNLCSKWNRKD